VPWTPAGDSFDDTCLDVDGALPATDALVGPDKEGIDRGVKLRLGEVASGGAVVFPNAVTW
jgi:hypothetical protein